MAKKPTDLKNRIQMILEEDNSRPVPNIADIMERAGILVANMTEVDGVHSVLIKTKNVPIANLLSVLRGINAIDATVSGGPRGTLLVKFSIHQTTVSRSPVSADERNTLMSMFNNLPDDFE